MMKVIRNLTLTFLLAFVVGWNAYGIYAVKPEVISVEQTVTISEPNVVDINQMHCLATNIYHEARGESFAGKVAVANVTHNRVDSTKYPNTYCGVVYQAQMYVNWRGNEVPARHKCQFSWYCDGKSDEIPSFDGDIFQLIYEYAELYLRPDVILIDITDGATHYHADYVFPEWRKSKTKTVEIGDHIFYRWEK